MVLPSASLPTSICESVLHLDIITQAVTSLSTRAGVKLSFRGSSSDSRPLGHTMKTFCMPELPCLVSMSSRHTAIMLHSGLTAMFFTVEDICCGFNFFMNVTRFSTRLYLPMLDSVLKQMAFFSVSAKKALCTCWPSRQWISIVGLSVASLRICLKRLMSQLFWDLAKSLMLSIGVKPSSSARFKSALWQRRRRTAGGGKLR
mmetsp:Transcript_116051/g.289843  ORF Transcript_116051/g.289843 Transcript_116051/m.289843 type:complete len:202 (+) Transcript_116051:709-1314(+)